jgi:putative CocE/NonD family hydrolase
VATRGRAGRFIDRAAGRLFGLPRETTDYSAAEVRVPTRDGVELVADLYRPTSTPVGTLLVRGPYGRWLLLSLPMARVFAARGYNVLLVSSRGTAGSGGTFDPMRTEADDGLDIVEWMRTQAWYTGTFATLGGSYSGYTQWCIMQEPPTDLVAAAVAIAPHDFWEHAWRSDSFRLEFLGWSNGIVHQDDKGLRAKIKQLRAPREMFAVGLRRPLAAAGSAYLGPTAPWWEKWVSTPDGDDPFWTPMRHGAALARAAMPTFLLAGWDDLFLEATIEQFTALTARGVDVALTVGPWNHVQVVTKGRVELNRGTFDWFEEHVAGRANLRTRRSVRLFVTGAAEWREYDSWPAPRGEQMLFLDGSGRLADRAPNANTPPSSFIFDPADPTPTVGGSGLSGRAKQNDSRLSARRDVLAFTGPVLDRDLEVIGSPKTEIVHSSDNPNVDVFVRISDVDAKGRSLNVTEGYLRLDPHRGDGPVQLALRPAAHRFKAGHRIRVIVAGGSYPLYQRNLGTGENPGTGLGLKPSRHQVHHGEGGASIVYLPIAGLA